MIEVVIDPLVFNLKEKPSYAGLLVGPQRYTRGKIVRNMTWNFFLQHI